MQQILNLLFDKQDLAREQAQQLFSQIISGEVEPVVLSAVLTALKLKGETVDEITGAASALRAAAAPFPRPDYEFADIVGTGGDGANTINISTTSAFIAAAAGIKVAKHGNRGVSSRSGSSDVLAQMGINLNMSAQTARACLDEIGLCFLFAPQYHGGVKYAMPVRQALKTRTIFNLLGPLINPAKPTFQLMGVYDASLTVPLAHSLGKLGLRRAMVVYGDGLDEMALHGETLVAEYHHGDVTSYRLSAADVGLTPAPLSALAGGSPEENRVITEAILQGKGSDAQQHAVALNVAPLLLMGGLADNWQQAAQLALSTIKSGQGMVVAQSLAEKSQC